MQPLRIATALAACCVLRMASGTYAGTCVTQDGQTLTGKIELKADNTVTVTAPGKEAVRIPLKNVTRLSMLDAAAPATAAAPDPGLPAPWHHADIGSVKKPGSAKEDHGTFTLQAAGWGIWGGKDSFHFLHQPLEGDFDMVAHIVSPPTAETPFSAGLEVRAGLEPDSAETSVMLYAEGSPRTNTRPSQGASPNASRPKGQSWVRLYRTGDLFISFSSSDGKQWTNVGSVETKVGGKVLAGPACAASANQELITAAFDNVSIRAVEPSPSAGIGLVEGSVIAGTVKAFDDKNVTYADAGGAERTLARDKVAYIFTRPMPSDMRGTLPGGKTGASLVSGDAIEATVNGLAEGKLTLTSVIFGIQRQEYPQVVSIVLKPVALEGKFVIHTRAGARYQCDALTTEDGALHIVNPILGDVTVKESEIAQLAAAQP